MGYKINLIRQWRGKRDVLHPGVYRVPRDLPEGLAQQMIEAGAAELQSAPVKRPGRKGDWNGKAVKALVDPAVEAEPLSPPVTKRPSPAPRSQPLSPPELTVADDRRFEVQTVVVAGTGPSLTDDIVAKLSQLAFPIVAVNDAYRLLPSAAVLYACDAKWWEVHDGCPDFAGEKWSSHTLDPKFQHNDKRAAAQKYGLKVIEGRAGEGFSTDPEYIHYGSNSGFQAVNLAILMGARKIVLVGFDMRTVKKQAHFFGDHPKGLRNDTSFTNFIQHFDRAAKSLPADVEIVNATPGSALKCFSMVSLDEALA